jgi:hypothetical protein
MRLLLEIKEILSDWAVPIASTALAMSIFDILSGASIIVSFAVLVVTLFVKVEELIEKRQKRSESKHKKIE